jgi:hypothetical protein
MLLKNPSYFLFLTYFAKLLTSCEYENGDKYLGRTPIQNVENVYFKIYRSQEFDYTTAISAEIVDSNDSIIFPKQFLTGTLDFQDNTKLFFADSKDSTIYISYFEPNRIYGVYDLKLGKGYPFNYSDYRDSKILSDSLLNKLVSYDTTLYAIWKE